MNLITSMRNELNNTLATALKAGKPCLAGLLKDKTYIDQQNDKVTINVQAKPTENDDLLTGGLYITIDCADTKLSICLYGLLDARGAQLKNNLFGSGFVATWAPPLAAKYSNTFKLSA